MTMKDMCETIFKAGFIANRDGTKSTAREIFEYSPTGELYKIFYWYEAALDILGDLFYCNWD